MILDAATLSLIVSLLSILGIVYLAGVKIAKIEVKVDTIWSFVMRRAAGEAISLGLGVMNSPIVFTPSAIQLMDGLADELKGFYSRLGRQITDAELALEIERRWGEKILKEVCIPMGMHLGACLLLAVAVAKKESSS